MDWPCNRDLRVEVDPCGVAVLGVVAPTGGEACGSSNAVSLDLLAVTMGVDFEVEGSALDVEGCAVDGAESAGTGEVSQRL